MASLGSVMVTESNDFRRWAESLREAVYDLSPDTASRYREPEQWEHYLQTGEYFVRLLPGQPALAQAGFMHGVREVRLVRKLKLGDKVEAILASRKRLWSIDKLDEDVPERLSMDVLPTTLQAAGALLLVVEQILHLDKRETMAGYTERSQRRPEGLTGLVESVRTAFPNLETQLAYMRRVVIPTAEYFGLWGYRNLAENLCLYYSDRERFLALQEFVLRNARAGVPGQREGWVRGILGGRQDVEVTWEWHHLDSLSRKLSGAASTWDARLAKCGRVTVVCPEATDCYTVLGALHLAPDTQHLTETEDLIQMARASGYQAIHTTLWRVQPDRTLGEAVRVRILSRAMDEDRRGVIDGRRLASMQRQFETRRVRGLQVFSNDGKAVALPAGSVVLNFACEIHGDLVALARGAMVNKELVDLLHPLREGDVVSLLVGSEPQELPAGWKKKVPPATEKRIEKNFKAVYQPHQIALGRKVLRQKLVLKGAKGASDTIAMDDRTLDSFIEDAMASLRAGGWKDLPTSGQMLRELGGAEIGPERRETASIIGEIALQVRNAGTAALEDLHLPKGMLGDLKEVQLCETCQPTPDKPAVGVLQNGRLLIHQAHRKCGAGGTPIGWRTRYSRGQHYVVEMTNRQGIAAEILGRVASRGIDLQEHVGAALGTGWAVLRLHVNAMPAEAVSKLTREIGEVAGVLRVLPPGSEVVQALEGSLPPRERRPIASRASPYLGGPVVTDDRFFYGRGGELAELRKLFGQIEGPEATRGIHAFVCGPLKTGKTSLVERFLREIHRSKRHCLVAKVQVEEREVGVPGSVGEGWLRVAERLREQLLANVGSPLREALLAEEKGGARLEDLVQSIRSSMGSEIVLVIDEVFRTFFASAERDDMDALLNFFNNAALVPGLMVVWVGPEAPVEDVKRELGLVLRTAEWVRVRPLKKAEVNQLLRAHNMEGTGAEIEVEEQIGEELWRFTGGNPYWCQLVGIEMFQQAEAGNRGVKLYTYETFEKACSQLAERGQGLSDRVAEVAEGSAMHGIVGVLLQRLAEVESNQAELSDEEMFLTAVSKGFLITEDRMRMVMERLLAQGSVRRETVRGKTYWKLDCPALRLYITRHRVGKGGFGNGTEGRDGAGDGVA